MRVLDLFSGIGGFSLGLERAGMETVAFCEIDPFCQKILKKHWPNVPIHEDITKLDGKQYAGTVDLICGGFPCQPFSDAGSRRGTEDDRHLWPEMLRIIKECQPTWAIGENVNGFVRMALEDVCVDLEAAGYEVQPVVIPACATGAPHRRDRVWVIGYFTGGRALMDDTKGIGWGVGNAQHVGTRSTTKHPPGHASKDVADPGSERLQERDRLFTPGQVTDAAVAAFEWWTSEPDVGRVAHGIPRRVDRIRALGNAVVPQIPEIIGRAIMQAEINSTNDCK